MTKEKILNLIYEYEQSFQNDDYDEDFMNEFNVDNVAIDMIVESFTNGLLEFMKDKTDNEKLYPTSNLELAMRDEIQDILENTEDERLVDMSDKKFDELVDIITYKVVYKNESIWETLNDVVSWELDNELESEND